MMCSAYPVSPAAKVERRQPRFLGNDDLARHWARRLMARLQSNDHIIDIPRMCRGVLRDLSGDRVESQDPTDSGERGAPVLDRAARLAVVCGLSAAEARVLAFLALAQVEASPLRDATRAFRPGSGLTSAQALAMTLAISLREAQAALAEAGRLVHAGLVRLGSAPGSLAEAASLSCQPLADALLGGPARFEQWQNSTLPIAPAARLQLHHYRHLGTLPELAHRILEAAQEHRGPGINILLHGRSGTGKTELARVLAQKAGLPLTEVPSLVGGEHLTPLQRLAALRNSQDLLRHRLALIVFDDVDDLLLRDVMWPHVATEHLDPRGAPAGTPSLGSVRALLGSNPTPTIWIAHDISTWPEPLVRRFELVIELGPPPVEHMQKWLEESAAEVLSPAAMRRLLALPGVTPGGLVDEVRRGRYLRSRC